MQPVPQPAGQHGAPPVAPSQQPPALAPGTILRDRYLIQGYISGGGFGHIYKALDNALGYRRAIKEAFYQDSLTRQQFHLEAEFLINVRHPNLVAGYAVFEQEGRLYLVMDYVDGHTLEEIAIDHIRRTNQPLTEPNILDWVLPICGALHALHSSPRPVIHRDVKPANVKINRLGIPVLIDLGLAKLFAPGTTTIGAALAFTPGYAPPEQYQASGATDARTDVYGMGASLFFLLTGYQPTEAPARLGSLAVPPLRQLNPAISPLTEAAVIKAMELIPEQRQQSALELERDLRAARAALADQARRGVWSAATPPGPVCAACGAENPRGAPQCTRCGVSLARAEAAPAAPEPAPAQEEPAARVPGRPTSPIPAGAPVVAPQAAAAAAAAFLEDRALVPGPDSVPDQPAMALPPLRLGPAPVAQPLAASAPQGAVSAADPAAVHRRAPRVWRAPAGEHVGRLAGAAQGPMRPAGAAGVWAFALPSLRRWHVETLAAASADESEARVGLAGVMSLVFAVGTLLSMRNSVWLLLAVGALALGHWCRGAASERTFPEARWLATLALAITYAWLALYSAGWLALNLHAWL